MKDILVCVGDQFRCIELKSPDDFKTRAFVEAEKACNSGKPWYVRVMAGPDCILEYSSRHGYKENV